MAEAGIPSTIRDESLLDQKYYAVSESKQMSMRDLIGNFKRHGVDRVTDLHIKVGEPPVYRLDGKLQRTSSPPMKRKTVQQFVRSLLSESELQTLKKRRSVNSSSLIEEMRIRVNAFFDSDGPALAIRALDTRVPEVEKIGFQNGVWEDIINLSHGLVLLTGATGAGKSTTIASLIQRISQTRACRIITLEDPVEYRLTGEKGVISQRAIGRDVPNFEAGMRDCLREDPDIIFIGEMTDQESASWTLTAAETGHLVFSALHTRNTVGTITRLLDMYPESRQEEIIHQLSLGLRYVITQKLLPKATTKGRVLAMEILHNNYAVSNMIRQFKLEQIYSVIQTQTQDISSQRMCTLERSLAHLVRKGEIDVQEAERQANHISALTDELQRIN
ncbi:MAG: type IV pilus twitching motility protein PilT [Phycisphaerae bacterium]